MSQNGSNKILLNTFGALSSFDGEGLIRKKPNDIVEGIKDNTKKILIDGGSRIDISTLNFISEKDQITYQQYCNGKLTKGAPQKLMEITPKLSFLQFINIFNTESAKQSFSNRNPEFYNMLLNKLLEYKTKLSKIEYKKILHTIESELNDFYLKKNSSYFDEVIKEDETLNPMKDLLENKNLMFGFIEGEKENLYLVMYDGSVNNKKDLKKINGDNTTLSADLIHNNGIESSFQLLKINNKELLKLLQLDIDLLKFLKGKVRGIGSDAIRDTLFKNLNSEIFPLIFMIYRKKKDLKNMVKLKNRLDSLNATGVIDNEFYRGVKFEIQNLSNDMNNKQGFELLLNTFKENPREAKQTLVDWYKTKKGRKFFEDFIRKITEKRGAGISTKYKNKGKLEMIIDQINMLGKVTISVEPIYMRLVNEHNTMLESIQKQIKKTD